MNKGIYLIIAVIFISSAPLAAQDYDFHPILSDSFDVSLGWFRSDNTFNISAGEISDDEIDFGDNVGVDESSTLIDLELRWKFGNEKKWMLAGQYFNNNADGSLELEEDVKWQEVIFREGTFVGAGVDLAVTRLFFGRSLIKKDRHDFGVGLGLHVLDFESYIEGEILLDDESTGFHRGEASKSQPLPNIGTWYNFSPAKKWLISARIDWISANIGDYDGTLWNTNVGVNYQAFRHVGFELSYQYFNLNLKVDDDDFVGGIDLTYSGPVIAVTANW